MISLRIYISWFLIMMDIRLHTLSIDANSNDHGPRLDDYEHFIDHNFTQGSIQEHRNPKQMIYQNFIEQINSSSAFTSKMPSANKVLSSI